MFVYYYLDSAIRNELQAVGNKECICSGDTVSYKCTVMGRGTTLWQGSAFRDCASNHIALLHSQFTSDEGAYGTCNNGAIVGWSIAVEDDCYTSQLNVTISTELDGSNVECVYDNGREASAIDLSMVIKLKGSSQHYISLGL